MRSWTALAVICLCGCTSPVALQSRFDPQEVAWFSARGTNSIEGTMLLRSSTGKTKTCTALPVFLFPNSSYARERMRSIYENEEKGFRSIALERPVEFDGDDPRYLATAKTAQCDARGRFSFSELPDGDYFVVGRVIWRERTSSTVQRGGHLMQRVHVEGGEIKEVLLSPEPGDARRSSW